jgi:hypothetical protein
MMDREVAPRSPISVKVQGIASLLCGVLGVPSMVADPAFGLLFGVIAVATAMVGLIRRRARGAWRGILIVGLVLGFVALVVFAVAVILIATDNPGPSSTILQQ